LRELFQTLNGCRDWTALQAALSRKLNVPSNMDLIAVSEWANKGTMLSEVVSKYCFVELLNGFLFGM
jgi:hypothetical protein